MRNLNNKLLIGCVADDFTGAGDIGSFFAKGGLKVVLINGIPEADYTLNPEVQVVIIALKTRNLEVEEAVKISLEAFKLLEEYGAKQLYFKYCSTFDSTKVGNIGPVIDRLLETYKVPYTIISPALPVNGRKVVKGHLYVNDIPLNESPMKNHPLTPMWSSNISELMSGQGKYKVYNFDTKILELEKKIILKKLDTLIKENDHFYIVPDYFEDKHAELIVRTFGNLPVLTGSSGLAYELAKSYVDESENKSNNKKSAITSSKGIIISGSCSVATGGQIKDYIGRGGYSIEIKPDELIKGEQTIDSILDKIYNCSSKDMLIYSYNNNVNEDKCSLKQEEKSYMLEQTMAEIGKNVIKNGFNRIVVAGGETSGAVTKTLGFQSFIIGDSISPGVPVLIPEEDKNVRLVLKSGNFGEKDFFVRALKGIEE